MGFWEMVIGVGTGTNGNTWLSNGNKGYGWIQQIGKATNGGGSVNYGANPKYGTGDEIEVVFSSTSLSFKKNGASMGVSHSNISPGKYCLAVSIGDNGDRVTFDEHH